MKKIKLTVNLTVVTLNTLLFVSSSLLSQQLVNSRNSSYYTYIFRINNDQAKKVYKRGIEHADNSFFSNMVDSFPTDSIYKKTLPVGHYLYVKSIENQLNLELKSENNISIQLLNNNIDLCIMVHDSAGNLAKKAKLYLNHKRIPFEVKTNTYCLPGNNRQGLLEVELDNQTAFYTIIRSRNNSSFKKAMNKVLYKSPVKYIYIPVSFTLNIPIDLLRSIYFGHRRGITYFLTQPFVTIIESLIDGEPKGFIENLFYHFNHKYCSRFNGEMYFSQPKYKPGDTVRFQAFIFDKKNKPVTDSLEVGLYTNGFKKLGYCKPVQPGIFVFEFKIKPALEMKLDRNYSVSLNNPLSYSTVSGSFKYEDYELKSTEFFLRSDRKTYRPHQPVSIFCKGVDENELIIPDARVELLVLATSLTKFKKDRDFVSDTLWHHEQNLDPTGETKIILPDSIFPEADVDARVDAQFRTSSNEWQRSNVTFERKFDPRELIVKLENDSVKIDYTEKGFSKPCQAELDIDDDIEKTVKLPYKEKVNPLFKEYYVSKDDLYEGIDLQDESPSVSGLSTRTKDSIIVSFENPRKLPLVYFVYKKEKCIYRGTESNLSFSCKNTTKDNYFVSLHYLWAGEIKSNEYKIQYLDKELSINAIELPVVYPGQKVKISLVVTDSKGKPVPNTSVLAYSYTKKFGQNFSKNLPYLGKIYPNRRSYNFFSENSDFDDKTDDKITLDWKQWSARMFLDSIELYKFLYPKKGMYQTSFLAKYSVTQVAPFLVRKGALAPVNIVYLDGRPVYFDLTTTKQPYSFQASPGRHKLVIRTYKKEIIFDSLYLQKGLKTILSIDVDSVNKKFNYVPLLSSYNSYERNTIKNYLLRVSGNLSAKSYLNQYNHYEILESGGYSYNSYSYIAGPFQNDLIYFKSFEGFHHSFLNEQNYEFEFHPEYYKMKCSSPIAYKKMHTSFKTPIRNFAELSYTSQNINDNWQQTVKFIQTNTTYYDNPHNTLPGCGSLLLEYIPKTKYSNEGNIKNLIILNYSDSLFARIYNGSERWIYDLAPGSYKLIGILQNNRYFMEDSLLVNSNGVNFVRLKNKNLIEPDTRIETINAIITRRLKKNNLDQTELKKDMQELDQKQIASILQYQQNISCLEGKKISGIVLDNTGIPLPGVCIVIKGTTIGTISDVNGFFCICVPYRSEIISISMVGYITEEMRIQNKNNLKIVLEEEIKRLDEVVVIGYGTVKKSDLTGSIATVQSSEINSSYTGRVSGVNISNLGSPGSGLSIRIRGVGSIESKAPLYVIDGVPFTGDTLALNKEDIEQVEILKDATAIAIYGNRGANGVVLITTKNGAERLGNKKLNSNTSMEGIQQENALRNRFSDLAFWKPSLVTDANGIASFDVTFPDDITSWNTFYYAYGAKSTGQKFSQIKSFKPLVGTLAVPRFLVKGDITNVIGKAINYTTDTIKIKTSFDVYGKSSKFISHNIITSAIDTFTTSTSDQDTLKIAYKLQKDDGYTDGEKRDIPVYPIGTKETVGQFWTLEGDTNFNINLSKENGEVKLVADAHPLSFALDELEHLRNYGYLCNEQAASKLKALLLEKRIFKILGKEFPYEKDIIKLIDKLESSRIEYGLWGWWPNSPYCTWISQHVIEALAEARKESYKVKCDFKDFFSKLVCQFGGVSQRDKMRILKVLMSVDSTNNYIDYLKQIKPNTFGFTEKLEYIELNQLYGMKPNVDTLMKWKKETYLGNYYWGNEGMSLFDDAVSSTLLVYRIFKRDSIHLDLLPKMRNYVLERRGGMYWRNTYESMKVLETVLTDIMVNKSVPKAPHLKMEGVLKIDTTGFPVKKSFFPDSVVKITKKGAYPVYLTMWQNRWNANPTTIDKDFVVKTYFEKKDSVLTAGEPVMLVAEVKVIKSSDYVMIEVPIPAGCSYEEKPEWLPHESHREYFKEKTVIFCDYLGEGTFQFKIKLQPRYTGIYNLNPARAELMYFPLMFGRNQVKKIIIK